jgi:hypothetical protein
MLRVIDCAVLSLSRTAQVGIDRAQLAHDPGSVGGQPIGRRIAKEVTRPLSSISEPPWRSTIEVAIARP